MLNVIKLSGILMSGIKLNVVAPKLSDLPEASTICYISSKYFNKNSFKLSKNIFMLKQSRQLYNKTPLISSDV
jgi:hypothetical protein